MPARFKQVDDLLYRGGAPKDWEIAVLKKDFGIEQIISLDKDCAKKISKACAKNNINHIIIPINSSNVYDNDLLLIQQGATSIVNNRISYVHCLHGKDRTGLFVAKYRIEHGYSCKEAIDEAISFGFGTGVDKDIIERYIEIIVDSCKENHKHVSIGYYFQKTKNAESCIYCGMIKMANFCNNCMVTNALIKNAEVLTKEINPKNVTPANVTREKESEEGKTAASASTEGSEDLMIGQDQVSGGTHVAPLFHIAKMNRTARINLLRKINKEAQQVTFKIPQEEKDLARKCIVVLENFVDKVLFKAHIKGEYKDLLDIMFNPFSEKQGITPEQATKIKPLLNMFVKLTNRNMINIKRHAAACLDVLSKFDSDSDVASMNKSFYDDIDNLSEEVKMFEDILLDTTDKDFQKNAIEAIKNLKKKAAQLKQLINERIIPYLRRDILNEDWTVEIKQDIIKDKEGNI